MSSSCAATVQQRVAVTESIGRLLNSARRDPSRTPKMFRHMSGNLGQNDASNKMGSGMLVVTRYEFVLLHNVGP